LFDLMWMAIFDADHFKVVVEPVTSQIEFLHSKL